MLALGALAVTSVDVAFFTPPHRPQRPDRRDEGASFLRDLLGAIRREIGLGMGADAARSGRR